MPAKEINFTIQLDEQNMPTEIRWDASDAEDGASKTCESLMIYMWDKEARNSMSIDLWTKSMLVDHMNIHFFHKLMKMADTFSRATGNQEGAKMLRDFAKDFAVQAKAYRDRQTPGQ